MQNRGTAFSVKSRMEGCELIFPWVTGSSNSSKYFASNDSSDTSRKARKSLETLAEHKHTFENQSENSLWSMIQHTPERVMMTYQIHTRYTNTLN